MLSNKIRIGTPPIYSNIRCIASIRHSLVSLRQNKYVEGVHYFVLDGDEMRTFRDEQGLPKNTRIVYLWTESGALLHAKSIKNDRAWSVYQELVNAYFRLKKGAVVTYDEALSDITNFVSMALSKINELTKENTRLKLMTTIDGQQQRHLQEIVKEKFGRDTQKYQKEWLAFLAEIWAVYRRKFHLDSYKNTPQYLFEDAVSFLENWQPLMKLRGEI